MPLTASYGRATTFACSARESCSCSTGASHDAALVRAELEAARKLPAARAAIEIGAAAGWDERRCQTSAEAITLHANLYVGRRLGAEAYLLYAGARLDQTGFRYGDAVT